MNEPKVEEKTAPWSYQNERVTLCPYVDTPNHPVFPEDLLVYLYNRLKKAKLIEKTFGGNDDLTLARFVSLLCDKPLVVGIEKETNKIIGFGWLWEIEGDSRAKKASVGFAFFPEWWGTSIPREAGRLACRWWFEEGGIGVLFGTIRKDNKAASVYAREMGFRHVAELPMFCIHGGKYLDVDLVMLTMDDLLAQETADGSRQENPA